jgi:hypothetical protein
MCGRIRDVTPVGVRISSKRNPGGIPALNLRLIAIKPSAWRGARGKKGDSHNHALRDFQGRASQRAPNENCFALSGLLDLSNFVPRAALRLPWSFELRPFRAETCKGLRCLFLACASGWYVEACHSHTARPSQAQGRASVLSRSERRQCPNAGSSRSSCRRRRAGRRSCSSPSPCGRN